MCGIVLQSFHSWRAFVLWLKYYKVSSWRAFVLWLKYYKVSSWRGRVIGRKATSLGLLSCPRKLSSCLTAAGQSARCPGAAPASAGFRTSGLEPVSAVLKDPELCGRLLLHGCPGPPPWRCGPPVAWCGAPPHRAAPGPGPS